MKFVYYFNFSSFQTLHYEFFFLLLREHKKVIIVQNEEINFLGFCCQSFWKRKHLKITICPIWQRFLSRKSGQLGNHFPENIYLFKLNYKKIFHPFSSVFIVEFEPVNVCWIRWTKCMLNIISNSQEFSQLFIPITDMKVKFDFKSLINFEFRVFFIEFLNITTGSGYWYRKSTISHIFLLLLSSKKIIWANNCTLWFCGFTIRSSFLLYIIT